MKESWRTDALRNIKKRIVSWLSIVTIVVISAGIILGISFPVHTLKQVSDSYFKKHNFKDADIASNIGIKASDVDTIRSNKLVKDAEGSLILPGMIKHGDKSCSLKVISENERISVPFAKEGALPEEKNECVVSAEIFEDLNLSIGDNVTIEMTGARFEDALPQKNFIVTGIVEHPDYFGTNRDGFCVVLYDAFDTEELSFDYTNIIVDAEISDDINTMESDYFAKADLVKNELDKDAEILAAKRGEEFVKDLDDEYAKAVQKVEDELAEGKEKLDDAQNEFDEKIADAEKELEDGEKEFADAKKKAEDELADGERKLEFR